MPATNQTALQDWLARFGPVVPLAAVLATLPYTSIYLLNLWSLPHYQFFPLLLAAVAVLVKQRWGGGYRGNLTWQIFRWLLLATGIGGTLCATLFASPWMGYFGFIFSLAAWLSYHRDAETGQSLLYLVIPVVLIWQPPYNTILTADTILIQTLQSLSAKLSSQWLDILGYAHHQPGTILEFAGRSFGVAEACSGIQSFFAVLCFGALLIVYMRRDLLSGLLLLATCPGWAMLMNTIRITAIPIAHALFGIDLSHGVLHDMLGYCTMGLALGLMLSTDELLLKLHELWPGWLPRFNLFQQPNDSRGPNASELTAGDGLPTAPSVSRLRASLSIPLLLLFALCFGIQSYDVSESWGHERDVIDFFRNEPLIEMLPNDAPKELAGWQQTKYAQENRSRGNDDLGQRSDLWFYKAPFGTATVSFDQMFPGWHELTRCYRSAGWVQNQRIVVGGEDAEGWPVVIVHLTRNNEHGYLVFSLVDRSGRPLQPPGVYSYWTILQERLRGRLTPAVRGALFGAVAYQLQTFVSTYAPLPEAEQAAVMERFLRVRGLLWTAAKERL